MFVSRKKFVCQVIFIEFLTLNAIRVVLNVWYNFFYDIFFVNRQLLWFHLHFLSLPLRYVCFEKKIFVCQLIFIELLTLNAIRVVLNVWYNFFYDIFFVNRKLLWFHLHFLSLPLRVLVTSLQPGHSEQPQNG